MKRICFCLLRLALPAVALASCEVLPWPEENPWQPSPACPPDVFPLFWEDFEGYEPGYLTDQSRRWLGCGASSASALIRQTPTNHYLVLDHLAQASEGRPASVWLPLSKGSGILSWYMWVPRKKGGRVGVLPKVSYNCSTMQGLELAFHPDRRLLARYAGEEFALPFEQEAWLHLMVWTTPSAGILHLEVRYLSNEGKNECHDAQWERASLAPGALLLDASPPDSRFFVDDLFYGWKGIVTNCERETFPENGRK